MLEEFAELLKNDVSAALEYIENSDESYYNAYSIIFYNLFCDNERLMLKHANDVDVIRDIANILGQGEHIKVYDDVLPNSLIMLQNGDVNNVDMCDLVKLNYNSRYWDEDKLNDYIVEYICCEYDYFNTLATLVETRNYTDSQLVKMLEKACKYDANDIITLLLNRYGLRYHDIYANNTRSFIKLIARKCIVYHNNHTLRTMLNEFNDIVERCRHELEQYVATDPYIYTNIAGLRMIQC